MTHLNARVGNRTVAKMIGRVGDLTLRPPQQVARQAGHRLLQRQTRSLAEIERELAAAHDVLRDVTKQAETLVEHALKRKLPVKPLRRGAPPDEPRPNLDDVVRELKEVANRRGKGGVQLAEADEARKLLGDVTNAREAVNGLNSERVSARLLHTVPAKRTTKPPPTTTKPPPTTIKPPPTTTKPPPAAVNAPTTPPVKPPSGAPYAQRPVYESPLPRPIVETPSGRRAPPSQGSKVTIAVHPVGDAAKNVREGGAQALLAMQLSKMRSDEAAEAEAEFARLRPKIDNERSLGRWVVVVVALDVPDTVDLAAKLVQIGDQSQVVYFVNMWMMTAGTREELEGVDTAGKPAPLPARISARDPKKDKIDKGPRPGFHRHWSQLVLAPYTGPDKPDASLPQPQGFAGTYRPVMAQMIEGREGHWLTFGYHRLLRIGGRSDEDATMWNLSYDGPYTAVGMRIDTQAKTLRARFFIRPPYRDEGDYVLDSRFQPAGGDWLIEQVTGEDKAPGASSGSKWSAAIYWKKG